MTRYVVIGAGAIGGATAGLLADAGIDVVAVARGAHAAAIAEQGLRVRTPERTFTVPIRCVTDPSSLQLGTGDVLVLATKTHQADVALRQWVDVPVLDGDATVGTAGELLPILTALNGVVSEEMALRYFERVIGVCVWMPAAHIEPGEVIVRGTPIPGTFHIGTVPAGRDESDLLDAVERDWTAAAMRIVRPDDVMPWKYRKLVSNLGNAFQALLGAGGSARISYVPRRTKRGRCWTSPGSMWSTTRPRPPSRRERTADHRGAGSAGAARRFDVAVAGPGDR